MTMDSTQVSHSGSATAPDDDMAAATQLAQASDDVEQVALPRAGQVVVVPVEAGQTVELPTADEDGLLAEIGPEGNLAFVVDGRTIILQGYASANDEAPVTIVTTDGETVDVAAVVAETDPSIEIQTAAGPAAGPQGGEAEAGNGIFVPFPADGPLGGFDGAGVLDPTELAYKLITDERKSPDLEDDDLASIEPPGEPEPPSAVPTANPDSATVTQSVATDYQLMLVIDTSLSMGQQVTRPDGTVTTRMELQKAAVTALLQSYAASTTGSVNVKLVQFSDDASFFGGTDASTFVDVADPASLAAVTAAIDALGPTHLTDYDAALATAQQGIADPSWLDTSASTKGLVYFFSDGRPVDDGDSESPYPGGNAANAIDQAEEDIWEGRTQAAGFAQGLADKGVASIAVGLGADIAGNPSALNQLRRVAYSSESFPDQSVIVVDDENELTNEIIQTVPATVVGNVLTNDDPGADGYGAPTIVSVAAVIDGDTTKQTVTETAVGFQVETGNGILIIDKATGDWSYTASIGTGGKIDSFTYTIQDGKDGDTDSATLTVTIAPPDQVSGTEPFDAGPGNNFVIGDDADNKINAGAGTDSVQGGAGNDAIDGGAGNDALHGQEGDDVLAGGEGNDSLLGGNGDDTLLGGAGLDALTGGVGDDVLDGGDDTLADLLSGGIGDDTLIWRGVDDAYDGGADSFNAAAGQAGDVLDAGNAASIDFTTLGDSQVENVETLRLNGGSGTTITLNAADVIDGFEGGTINPGGSGAGGAYGDERALRVDGDAGDSVDLFGGGWSKADGATGLPAGYTLYVHDAGGGSPGSNEDAYVLVQNGVTVTGI